MRILDTGGSTADTLPTKLNLSTYTKGIIKHKYEDTGYWLV